MGVSPTLREPRSSAHSEFVSSGCSKTPVRTAAHFRLVADVGFASFLPASVVVLFRIPVRVGGNDAGTAAGVVAGKAATGDNKS